MKSQVTLKGLRKFSEEFKRQIVQDYEYGKLTIKELARVHQLARSQIYEWIYRYSIYNKKGLQVVEYSDSSEKRIKELQEYIKELERALGRSKLEGQYNEKLIELAKEKLGIDLKKNFDTSQSSGSSQSKDGEAGS